MLVYIMKRNPRKYRKIAQQQLGRRLKRGELVHHKDGNETNDAPENLQVVTTAKHGELHAKMNAFRKRLQTPDWEYRVWEDCILWSVLGKLDLSEIAQK